MTNGLKWMALFVLSCGAATSGQPLDSVPGVEARADRVLRATTPESPETTVNVTVNVNTDDQDAVVQSTMTNEDGEEVELPALAVDNEQNYEVVGPPLGATVPYLPEEADKKTVDSVTYYVFEGTYYQPFASGDEVIYMVVEVPEG